MGLTIEQLVPAKTKEQLRAELLLFMQGVGYVQKVGAGEGSIGLSGVAAVAAEVVIQITTAGALGAATFQYSLDAGATYNGVDVTVPSLAQYALGATGVTITFENGPGDLDLGFLVGDFYSFTLTIPTLNTTSWAAGSTPLTIMETDAAANEDFSQTQQNLAKSGFLSTAADAWLDLHLHELYATDRIQGQVAKHTVRLTDAGNSGPHSIAAGQLTVATATGLRFSNDAGGTLTMGGTLNLTFSAERRGTAYNVAVGAINLLLTTIAGVTVTNPDLGGGTSLTQQGVNRETDGAAQDRAGLQWSSLGTGATEDKYKLWARTASTSVTRVRVKQDTSVGGGLILLLAGPAGPVSGGIVTTVQDYVEPRVPFGTILTAQSAAAQAVAISATVYVHAGYGSTALAAIQANLIALFQGGTNSKGEALPGIDISDGSTKVYVGDIIEALQIPTGVRNVDLPTVLPAADAAITADYIATLSPSPVITIVEV